MISSVHGYIVEEQIGRGGMSTVYRGRHRTLGYPVAIKFLDPGLAANQEYIARFEREAVQASALESPHIVRTLDYGSEGTIYFIVMEYVDGKDLAHVLNEIADHGERTFLPAEIALLILDDVCRGLQAAHDRGIIHRDIKPSNILLDQHGFAKIGDFGLARELRTAGTDPTTLTYPGAVMGTPAYMSPEQAAGHVRNGIDTRSDIFSLGVTAFHLLTGRKPFSGSRASEIQEKIIREAPLPLTQELCPQLTPSLQAMVARMLEKNPDKRFLAVGELSTVIRACVDEIDPSGEVAKRRHDYIKSFMNDPVGCAESLRKRAVAENLRLGYYYRTLGDDHLQDATRVLALVDRIDPGNPEATRILAELHEHAEYSGLPSGIRPPARRAFWPYSVGLLVVVAGLLGWLMLPGLPDGESRPAAAPLQVDSASTTMAASASDGAVADAAHSAHDTAQAPASETAASPPSSTAPATETRTETSLPPKPAPPRPAQVDWSSTSDLAVLVDGREVRRSRGPQSLELSPGRSHELVFRDPETRGEVIREVTPGSGQVIDLGVIVVPAGTAEIFGVDGMEITVDGRECPAPGGESETLRLGAGVHLLAVKLAGYEASRASLLHAGGFANLAVVERREDQTVFRFTIAGEGLHKISLHFQRSGG